MTHHIGIADIKVGDFLTEVLWTDTLAWVVVGKTAKSITVVRAVDTDITATDTRIDGPWPRVFTAVAAPTAWEKEDVRRFFDKGKGLWATPTSRFRPGLVHQFEDGVVRPIRVTDYRY